jgi:hypothetical protein
MVCFLFTSLGICASHTSYCQENYLPGYIINQQGDTLQGFIDYRNWEHTPEQISFRAGAADPKHFFSPASIMGFAVKDEIYESAIIETETSTEFLNNLDYNSDFELQTDTAFLQTMIRGPKSLYYYRNKNGKEQLYIGQNNRYELLLYKKHLSKASGKSQVREKNTYKSQLASYLQDCPAIQSELAGLVYRKKSIERLFTRFYDCTQTAISFQKKTEKIYIETALLAGLSISTIRFVGEPVYQFLTEATFNQSLKAAGGLSLEVVLPRNRASWSLCNELFFTSYHFNGYFVKQHNPVMFTTHQSQLGYFYLKINNLVRYKHPIGNAYMYLNAGISNGLNVKESNYRQVVTRINTSENIKETLAVSETRKHEMGFLTGIGGKYKKFSLEARFERGDGMSRLVDLASKVHRYYFLLGYNF